MATSTTYTNVKGDGAAVIVCGDYAFFALLEANASWWQEVDERLGEFTASLAEGGTLGQKLKPDYETIRDGGARRWHRAAN